MANSGNIETVRNRDVSVWDFVPIVGSLRTVKEGIEDLSDGNAVSGVVNVAIGIGCLVLDVATLRSYGSGLKALGKVASKGAANGAVKEFGKKAMKGCGKGLKKVEKKFVKSMFTYGMAVLVRKELKSVKCCAEHNS